MSSYKNIILLTLSISSLSFSDPAFHNRATGVQVTEVNYWYRGNTHAHARYSDKNKKDDIPEIARWYRKAGYNFLAIAEHNDRLTKRKVICHDEAAHPPDFIMLCALELSESRHLTALGITNFIDGENSLQDGVRMTLEAGGIPILNHPQEPVVKASDFIKTKGLNHLEVFNGNNPQDTPACERLWDSVLSAPDGRMVYALASDDNHYSKSKVGRGWIMVDAKNLTKSDIASSISKGKFYATTGISLTRYSVTEKSVTVETQNGSKIWFIGRYGKILKKVEGNNGSMKITGTESYIRIKITNEEGMMAWTQPFLTK